MILTESSILIIDDNDEIRESLKLFLGRHFSNIVSLSAPNNLFYVIDNNNFDIILLDMNFSRGKYSGNEGLFWLKEILKRNPELVIILITAYGKIDLAVNGIKEGAFDFILKPWENEKLLSTIKAGIKLKKSNTEVKELKEKQQLFNTSEINDYKYLHGPSLSMKKIDLILNKVAGTDANILILGENGTGKEVIAREIHRRSLRNNQVFMSVDLSSLTNSLFESELFGYKQGAFTDAKEDRLGKIEASHNGTLFLDEIGNLPVNLQSKLLTVIQTKSVTRLGSIRSRNIDFRLICATNKPLTRLIQEGLFREDLLFRINTVQIEIPALRNRKEDILPFCEYFLDIYNKKYSKKNTLSKSAISKLENYHWPGNIRELKHSIERISILSTNNNIKAEDFAFIEPLEAKTDDQILNLLELEQVAIKKAIKKSGGNMSKAAEILGISRTTLYFKLSKYGL
ncbi:MAG: sigma-54-dependent Fis family transcriptional regulator [Bacteroidetes bacterium GWC2_33_15]|nr:MAG: sigma-54-dependent Fis family transcriptional regulator [Bacteroidetes bacterium GWA2_33_15]OFX49954.1 MAG: sigma-54-dependent Fis family transcriptional regulator [Bacteroidetes bacterium GWC2_33_15]OFX64198.1 MAG: sigma-54-dependent Fis family transcriptional regulator [Bacteroidetes bacterium GWB2_32_14]OFX69610.1 MAG: sigma-54-dependent Fis family transcriptional regulator [Bacteroidetes bacterium GWD2_33_33]HAN19493.1 sigma-54-dependent Fis family transcriptional regulator [Bactero